jgi:hypothetical protein
MVTSLTEEQRVFIPLLAVMCILVGMVAFSQGRLATFFPFLERDLTLKISVCNADTSKPISDAQVRAEWWCGGYPQSDRSGSPNITLGIITDENGRADLNIPHGLKKSLACPLTVTISKPGYIPERIVVSPTTDPLPDPGEDRPFMITTPMPKLPGKLDVSLIPALPVYLAALTDNAPLIRTTAAVELGCLPALNGEREEVIRALTNALDDQNPQVRRAASWAMEEIERTDR